MERNKNNEWGLLIGVALIVFGVWLLGGRLLGPIWEPVRVVVSFLFRIAWPLAIIGVGVILIVTARRGGLRGPVAGARLYRSRTDRMVSGVLAGFGSYFGIDPTWMRIGYVLLAMATGFWPALIAYIIGVIVIPEEPLVPPVVDQWPTATPPAGPAAPTPPSAPVPPTPDAPEPPAVTRL